MTPDEDEKYEITDIAHPDNPKLHRIRALTDVGTDVHKGDLGGFVETEDNLDQEGLCMDWQRCHCLRGFVHRRRCNTCGFRRGKGTPPMSETTRLSLTMP